MDGAVFRGFCEESWYGLQGMSHGRSDEMKVSKVNERVFGKVDSYPP